jgi:hypothetical protein
MIGALKRFAHVPCHWTSHHQDICVARRRDEVEAKTFQIVERVVEGVNLKLAAVAGAGIHLPNSEASSKSPSRGPFRRARQLFHLVAPRRWSRFGESASQALKQDFAHRV